MFYRHQERQCSKEIWKTAIKQVADVSEMLQGEKRQSTKVIVLKLNEFGRGWQESSTVQPPYSFLMMQNGRNLLSKGPVAMCSASAASRCCLNCVTLYQISVGHINSLSVHWRGRNIEKKQ